MASDIDPCDGYNLRDYRDAVLKMIKLLIRARAACEPEFLSREEYARWRLAEIDEEPWDVESLLKRAGAAHDYLWGMFIGPHGSGGINPEDPRSELKELVVQFTIESPATVLRIMRDEDSIDWPSIANWQDLGRIRDLLDSPLFPDAAPSEKTGARPSIEIVDAESKKVRVGSHDKQVTQAGLDVLTAVLESFPATLTKDQLVVKSGHTDAVNILKRISEKNNDWRSAIKLAGETGGGYGIHPAETT